MPTNPAFLTFKQYLKIINEDGKRHPDSAYQTSVDSLNGYHKVEEYPERVRQFRSNGRAFEIRQKVTNLWGLDYVKTDKDGDLTYDDQGKLVYLTRDEIKALGKPEIEYEQAIIDKQTGKIVAATANEWGCLLVVVTEEYQGMGLGPMLSYENRSRQPERISGGMTYAGENSCFKAYQRMVAEHLTQGGYREALLEGDISFNDISRILKSARVIGKYVEAEREQALASGDDLMAAQIKKYDWGRSSQSRFDLDFHRQQDIRLYADESFAILYNVKLFDLLNDKKYPDLSVVENFMDEGILGYGYVGGTYEPSDIPKLFRVYGHNESTRSLMAEVMLNMNIGLPVRVLHDDLPLIRKGVMDESSTSPQERSPFHAITLETPTLDALPDALLLEKLDRQQRDNPYGEFWDHIQEMAYGIAEHDYEKGLENDEEGFSLER